MEDAHAKTSEEVLKYFGTNEEVGLTADQVKTFQAKYGPNGKLNLLTFSRVDVAYQSCFIIFGRDQQLVSLLHLRFDNFAHMFALDCKRYCKNNLSNLYLSEPGGVSTKEKCHLAYQCNTNVLSFLADDIR